MSPDILNPVLNNITNPPSNLVGGAGLAPDEAVVLTHLPGSISSVYMLPEAFVEASCVFPSHADMDVPSAALTLPTTTWGGILCAGADMGQEVMLFEGKLAVEAVRFSSSPPPCAHTMLSLAQTVPILNLTVFPSHEE